MASLNFFQTQFLPLGLHVWLASTPKESPKPTKLHMTPFGLPLLYPVSTTGCREMKTSLTEGSTRCSQQTHTICLGLPVLSSRSNLDLGAPDLKLKKEVTRTRIKPCRLLTLLDRDNAKLKDLQNVSFFTATCQELVAVVHNKDYKFLINLHLGFSHTQMQINEGKS